jgi:uncharacterized membrane protein YiaA
MKIIQILKEVPDKFWMMGIFVAVTVGLWVQPGEITEKAFWFVLGGLMTVLRSNATTNNVVVADSEAGQKLMSTFRPEE